jgi:ATP-binding cassette subfamily B protein
VFVLGERLMNAVFGAGMLYESSLFIEDFTSFVAMAPEVEARRPRGPAPQGFRRLRVEDVSFTYPSGTFPAVSGVSMEIGAGEIVALVGENGSGKTTLAKLLCRLYLPEAGRVLWDGTDTATVDPDELRRSVAVIFQDFVHYALPAAENIGMGRHQRISDLEAVRPSCPTATRPCSDPSSRAARSCRSASGSGSPWPGRSSATPRSSSSTSRPRPWTPGPSTSCSTVSGPCAGAGRCC